MSDVMNIYRDFEFACPVCKAPLQNADFSFSCLACNRSWGMKKGIVDFCVEKPGYWGEYSQEVMQEMILRAQQAGWQEALKEKFLKTDPSYYEYILDESRADWHFIVPLKDDARILDLGCGWGTLSVALSRIYKEVVAFDTSASRIEFVSLRRQSENLSNLLPVCGQINHLPFSEAYFDLAILNGVLEWVPTVEGGIDPYQAQLGALKQLRRVLKKDAFLYLAIENRWSFLNFLGYKDTHSGLRFAPLLPRRLANMYSRRMRKRDFREYTYTYGEHVRMLTKAGFSRIRFFSPIPSYRRFHNIVSIDDDRAVRFFLKNLVMPRNTMQAWLLAFARAFFFYKLVKYFVPDFSILAQPKD
jgi:SAM-dependent methyltransferase